MKVAVIGSGVGGLTSAAYLAQKGHDVTVFEQFPTIGGVTSTLKNESGFQWDLGQKGVEHKTPLEGLWFVGARRESGGALFNVMPGAFRTAQRVHEASSRQ
jgi:phytoene dehydrogenase-like protein